MLVRVFSTDHPHGPEIIDAARRAALVEDARLQRVLAAGEERGTAYIVLERVPGRSLGELLTVGPLPAETARRVIGEAAQALDRASTRGLHHLRLRPTSLIIGQDGVVTVSGTAIDAAAQGEDGLPSAARPSRRRRRARHPPLCGADGPLAGFRTGGTRHRPTDRQSGRSPPATSSRVCRTISTPCAASRSDRTTTARAARVTSLPTSHRGRSPGRSRTRAACSCPRAGRSRDRVGSNSRIRPPPLRPPPAEPLRPPRSAATGSGVPGVGRGPGPGARPARREPARGLRARTRSQVERARADDGDRRARRRPGSARPDRDRRRPSAVGASARSAVAARAPDTGDGLAGGGDPGAVRRPGRPVRGVEGTVRADHGSGRGPAAIRTRALDGDSSPPHRRPPPPGGPVLDEGPHPPRAPPRPCRSARPAEAPGTLDPAPQPATAPAPHPAAEPAPEPVLEPAPARFPAHPRTSPSAASRPGSRSTAGISPSTGTHLRPRHLRTRSRDDVRREPTAGATGTAGSRPWPAREGRRGIAQRIRPARGPGAYGGGSGAERAPAGRPAADVDAGPRRASRQHRSPGGRPTGPAGVRHGPDHRRAGARHPRGGGATRRTGRSVRAGRARGPAAAGAVPAGRAHPRGPRAGARACSRACGPSTSTRPLCSPGPGGTWPRRPVPTRPRPRARPPVRRRRHPVHPSASRG